MGTWLDDDVVTRFQTTQTSGVACSSFNGDNAGRWVDRSGNVSDLLCVGPTTDRFFLSNTHAGAPAPNSAVMWGATTYQLSNLGQSATGLYFAAAVFWDTYYGQLFSDSDGTRSSGLGTQTTGIRLQYDSDFQEWQLCVGTGTGQVAVRVPSGSLANFTSPGSWFVVDGYVNPAGSLVSLRVNKGTPVTAALAAFATGVSPMRIGVMPDGSDATTGGMKLARVVMTKNYIPVSTTRDSIVDELKALVGIP